MGNQFGNQDRFAAKRPPENCDTCATAKSMGARYCPDCGSELKREKNAIAAAPDDLPPSLDTGDETPPANSAEPISQRQPATAVMPEEETAPTPLPVDKCECGRHLPDDCRFCPACGAPVGAAETTGLFLVATDPEIQPTLITERGCTVGKDSGCDVVIRDDEFVSRRHARVRIEDGNVIIEDLGSSNGTHLRIHRPTVLKAGDEIVIGKQILRVELKP